MGEPFGNLGRSGFASLRYGRVPLHLFCQFALQCLNPDPDRIEMSVVILDVFPTRAAHDVLNEGTAVGLQLPVFFAGFRSLSDRQRFQPVDHRATADRLPVHRDAEKRRPVALKPLRESSKKQGRSIREKPPPKVRSLRRQRSVFRMALDALKTSSR